MGSTDLTFYFSICHNSKNMEFFNSIPSHMDYDGQQKAETWSRRIVVLFGLVGLAWGYWIQQFSQTVYILGAGLAFAAMVSAITLQSSKQTRIFLKEFLERKSI